MNAARNLVTEADAASDSGRVKEGTEASVRGWWQQQQRAAAPARPCGPASAPSGAGCWPGHSRSRSRSWCCCRPASASPSWLVPVIEAVLLAVNLTIARLRSARRSAVVRSLSAVLVFVLVAGAAFVARAARDRPGGRRPGENSAADLLRVGAGVWLYTIIAFAFLYWLLDARGPEARILDPPEFPDLAFPQQLNPVVARPGWRPEFSDYLYLGFTNATAFSPTDVIRWPAGQAGHDHPGGRLTGHTRAGDRARGQHLPVTASAPPAARHR